MKIIILCVGRTREPFIQEGLQKYIRFLKPYADVEIREIKEEKIADLKEAPAVRKKEAERIQKAVPAGAVTVALDERGQGFTSHEFAEFLGNALDSGVRELVFVIGGAMGLDESVPQRAHKAMAMSRWTLTHEMARIVLLEQVYRAFTIIKGKKYHY